METVHNITATEGAWIYKQIIDEDGEYDSFVKHIDGSITYNTDWFKVINGKLMVK